MSKEKSKMSTEDKLLLALIISCGITVMGAIFCAVRYIWTTGAAATNFGETAILLLGIASVQVVLFLLLTPES